MNLLRQAMMCGLGLLAAANAALAQGNPNGGQQGGAPGGDSSQQEGLGGPAGGAQQQQERQRRQRLLQSASPSSGPSQGQAPTGTSEPGSGASLAPGGSPPAGGVGSMPGEPSGATTPRAQIGGSATSLSNVQVPRTGAARVLAAAPERLSLPEAVRIGLENNLATLLATERAEEARGALQQVRSFLLPNISAAAYQQNRTLNLAAQGLSGGNDEAMGGNGGPPPGGGAPPIPSFVGPFNTFDARLIFSQSILNLAALREYKSNKASVRLAELNTELAREQVATYVALTYLAAQRSRLEVAAARADLRLAEELRELALKQRKAGIANGVDVVRAETRASQERLRAVQAAAGAEQTRLDFERAIGLPQGSATVLTDTLNAAPVAPPALAEALQTALVARPEARLAEQALEQTALQRRARAAERLPSVDAFGDYGQSANTPFKNDRMTRAYGVRLSVPVFDGGFTRGRVAVAASQERQAEWQLGDARGQVEEEVRQALLGWRLALEQVRAAAEQFGLAERELELATQRFRAGVADNLEVVRAQAGLANARALRVQALVQYGTARLNFAAATGAAQSFRL